jgi:hypothetical protein
MYDPYADRQARRAQRRYERQMRRYYRYQNPLRGLAGGLFLLALIIGFALNNVWGGHGFLVMLFIGLAFASLFGSLSTRHCNGIYGGFHGFIWMLGLALCFAIGFWPWIMLPIAVSMILGALSRPIMNGLAGAAFLAASPPQQANVQQPYSQPEQPGYQPYQQGYQGTDARPHEAYQESSQQYEQPQVQYPEQPQQELPPMEQR